ncbi:MAG TPA: hypothetical protein VHT24_17865 [Pseudacidobacterium sp.]|jgi:hypothetical protein|nr:hypothetical protein [Pseudacidobacterium sp.]
MFFQRRDILKLFCASLLLFVACIRANADAAVLLEEPFGEFGDMNPTGHSAIYLNHVCAASPTELRLCEPGEHGVVISRYHRVGGYDWLAIPLIPYLYAVDDPRDVPASMDAREELELRDRYRREHLVNIVPDDPKREIPAGEWIQLIGASYDRKIYGFQIETSEEQDARLIEALNVRSNRSHFNLFFNNCANFTEAVLNFYYPHSVHRNYIADAGLMTPKQAARSLVAYSKHHSDLQFTTFVIPQVRGTIHRSDSIDGVLESLVKTKKYAVPIAVLHPFVAGGIAIAYLGDGRFHPDRNAAVFDPAHEFASVEAVEDKPDQAAPVVSIPATGVVPDTDLLAPGGKE